MKKSLNYVDFSVACKISLELIKPITNIEFVDILNSLGRVVSKDIFCKKNLPAFDNSAMDGFACKFEDRGKTLKIVDTIFAGDKKEFKELKSGECYKIMTGAKTPFGTEVVIPFELCEVSQNSVKIPEDIKLGSNIRLKGEEQKLGNILIKKGEKITSSHIALLATQGLMVIEVFKKLNIAILSTGNELKEPWEDSNDDEIYNCNAFALQTLLKENDFEATYCGVIPDNLEETVSFLNSLKKYDIVLSSGGISMGEADFLAEAFEMCGLKVAYHGVNLKPGRAMLLGELNSTIFISLPGNPLAALINCYLFVMPILKKYQNDSSFYHDFILCENKTNFKVKGNRAEAVFGKVTNGVFEVTRENKYGSGMISAIYESNALAIFLGESNQVLENRAIKVLEFKGRFTKDKVAFIN
ncbi:molybdopterin molybdotransferase MoeA [Arcobacter vandammei]|uniref:molybdopterin molybdotransferase MoeA n=1 Tax=Arcobacter vandammei TaxID=2782243 RepID=UPI0018DF1089|nr:molybdopterin molybdotransferase MoeA [Arcobacter vandammei]